jgi:glycosyltransferase involved in cell wall biosynthesis
VSEETKKNINVHLNFAADRLIVIENCYSPLFQRTPKAFDAACPTILQVGTKSYKNVIRLVRALKGVHCRLVLVGKIDNELADELVSAEVDYVNHVNLSHEALVRKYVACDMVTFASIGEGFGVPIIEAQAVGRPLVTSDVSPLREVAGPVACLVDPLSEEAIRAGICRVIEDATFRADLVAKGLVNAQRFSAASISERYLAVYTAQIAKSSWAGRTSANGGTR